MRRTICAAACMLALAAASACAQRVTLTVSNPLDEARPGAICVGPASLLDEAPAPGAFEAVSSAGERVAVQLDDLDGDGSADEMVTVLDMPADTQLSLWVDMGRPWQGPDRADARTSWRYEDYAALDTDHMGFGLYGTYAPLDFVGGLQWDIYGKRPEAWALSLDALEDVNYHEDNAVAVDVLLVGDSVGLGGPLIGESRPIGGENARHACREICDGPVRAGLEVTVADWRTGAGGVYRMVARYFVYAGHDFIDARFAVTPERDDGGAFGVGVRRIPHPDAFIGAEEAGVLGVMGRQEGVIGTTGLGLVFEPQAFARWGVQTNADDGYVAYLAPELTDGPRRYRAWLVGVWGEGGIATAETFDDHLLGLSARMQAPVTVTR